MIKKYNQREFSNNPANLLEFYQIITELKSLFRQGWLRSKIKKDICESVAEHSFSTAMTAIFLLSDFPELNAFKVIRMCLIHDIAESVIGDIVPDDNVNREDKYFREHLAITNIFSNLKDGQGWISLWEDFDNELSAESLFVKDIDKLDMLLQAKMYAELTNIALSDFYSSAIKSIKNGKLLKIANDILKDIR